MGIYKTAPRIVTSGMIWYVDGLNPKSYPGSGTSVLDLITKNNIGTITGSPSVVNGNWVLNGTSQYVLSTVATSNDNDPYTWSCWAKATTYGYFAMTRGADGYGTGWSLGLSLSASGAGANIVTMSAGATGYGAGGTTPLSLDTWYFLTGTWDPGVSVKIYLNGVLDGTLAMSTTTLRSSTVNWNIGIITSAGSWFPGSVGPCFAYNRVLTDAEILQNFNATRGRYGL